MAITHDIYDSGLLGLADGSIDWDDASDVAAVLLDDSYSPDLSVHSTYGDLSGEIDDADYSPQAVTGRAITLNGGSVDYTSDDVVFGSDVSIGARYIVFVQGDPSNLSSGDPLISVQDFGEMVSSTNAEYRVNMDGYWFRLSVSE